MRYLVFSDSHSSPNKIKEAIKLHLPGLSGVIFLGDGANDIEYAKMKFPDVMFACVKGNCDFGSDLPLEMIIDLDGIKILISHGHKYNVKYGYEAVARAAYEKDADAVFFGHTHIPLDTMAYFGEKGIHLFNPGSLRNSSYGIVNTSGKVLVTSYGEI